MLRTATDRFDRRLKITHDATELRQEVAFAYDLTIFIERCLTGNMDRRAPSDFRDVGVTNRRFQTLRDQIKGDLELLYFNCPIPSSPASST